MSRAPRSLTSSPMVLPPTFFVSSFGISRRNSWPSTCTISYPSNFSLRGMPRRQLLRQDLRPDRLLTERVRVT